MPLHRTVTLTIAGLGLVLAMSGCSGDDTAEANTAYCEANSAAKAEAASLKSVVSGGTATVDDVKQQVENVKKAVEKATNEGKELSQAVKDEIQSADEAFTKAVEAIPGDSSLSQASAQYQSAVTAWEQSVATIRSAVGCQ